MPASIGRRLMVSQTCTVERSWRRQLTIIFEFAEHQLDAVHAGWVEVAAVGQRLGTKDGNEFTPGQPDGLPLAILCIKTPARLSRLYCQVSVMCTRTRMVQFIEQLLHKVI